MSDIHYFSKADFAQLSTDEKLDFLFDRMQQLVGHTDEIFIPVAIYNNPYLTVFEATVKYLKDHANNSFVAIGKLLSRSDKTIWLTYKKAIAKMPQSFPVTESDILVPVSALHDRQFTVFQALVKFLKERKLKNTEIAKLVNRDDRTIWATINRKKSSA